MSLVVRVLFSCRKIPSQDAVPEEVVEQALQYLNLGTNIDE
jgi:hypothetical protein